METNRKYLVAGVAAFVVTGIVLGATYLHSKSSKAEKQSAAITEAEESKEGTAAAAEESKEDTAAAAEDQFDGFEDPDCKKQLYLTKIEAENRGELVSEVNYALALGLNKGG